MSFFIPENVKYLLSSLESRGYRADIVGGSVRDLLLGKTPDDYDITTSATPDETKAVFADERTVDTGIKHGTVSIILEGRAYEITTYRVDGEYKDSRHPETVSFTRNIEEDLARRDFTVNAIAYSPVYGITDPFGGRGDLERGIIRAVGDPDLRFSEDALRILRGIRFSAVLGFGIEEKTAAALRERKSLLKNVSAERIYVELRKMISASYAYGVINEYSDVITLVIPSLDRIILPDEGLFAEADYTARLLSMFYLSADEPASAFDKACTALRTDAHIRELGREVLLAVGKFDLADEISLTHALRELGEEKLEALLRLEILLGRAKSEVLSAFKELLSSGVCYRISQLKVDGRDMMSLGLCGKQIGEVLESLLSAVIDRHAENQKETLLVLAKEMKEQKLVN